MINSFSFLFKLLGKTTLNFKCKSPFWLGNLCTGIPSPVIERARAILSHIQKEAGDRPLASAPEAKTPVKGPLQGQSFTGALFSDEEMILDEILSSDTDSMTPLSALLQISKWKKLLSGR